MLLDDLSCPIVLAPLAGGASTPELAAAVAGAGGLGFLGAGYLDADTTAAGLAAARALTPGPLGVNVFVPDDPPADPDAVAAYAARIAGWAEGQGLPAGDPRHDDDQIAAKLDVLCSEPPDVVS